ncbi:hypothetical protein SGFS_092160 [Streptomyces graminofaciens]|uniref:Uncharacterized protein n=1 Tax=Streptomyces graminofaciens TaxID=68212 RepID=A0ABN5W191_9ACTN|nr:hypothetical protein SGFS_092160 [Streptomyces graminofaciens]
MSDTPPSPTGSPLPEGPPGPLPGTLGDPLLRAVTPDGAHTPHHCHPTNFNLQELKER